jgi:CTP synthase
MRQLAFEEGVGSCCYVALTYVPEPPTLGEQKSKPAQLNIKQLMATGVMPHIIACRANRPVTDKVREKLALYSNVPVERVFSMHDLDSVYLMPDMLRDAGIDAAVLNILDLQNAVDDAAERRARETWNSYTSRYRAAATPLTIGITGKYTSLRDSYASIIQALEHAGTHCGARVRIAWIDSSEMGDADVAERMGGLHGVIVPGGFGVRGVEGKIACVRFAREKGIPYLGLCYGFQIAVIEFARSACGLRGANSTEIDPGTPYPVIDILPGQKEIEGLGGNMRLGGHDIAVTPATKVAELHGHAHSIRLRFRHRYEVAPRFIEPLEKAGLVFSGRAPDHPIMQVLELPADRHPFFVATQAHAELTSRPLDPAPMFVGLVRAALARIGGNPADERATPTKPAHPVISS